MELQTPEKFKKSLQAESPPDNDKQFCFTPKIWPKSLKRNFWIKLNILAFTIYLALHKNTDHDSLNKLAKQQKEYEINKKKVLQLIIPANISQDVHAYHNHNSSTLTFKQQIQNYLIYPKNTKLCSRASVDYLADSEIEDLINDSKYESGLIKRRQREMKGNETNSAKGQGWLNLKTLNP